MRVTQVTFAELLQDPAYKGWFQREPKRGVGRPWRVWYQHKVDGPWVKKDFSEYRLAYRWVVKNWRKVNDLTLCCPSIQMPPPILVVGKRPITITKEGKKVQAMVPIKEWWTKHHLPLEHYWCGCCRRPTTVGYFRRHHAIPGRTVSPYELRCRVCGARLSFQRYR